MPWAVAWYADRKSVLIPDSPKDFDKLNDYRILGAPLAGLYLTPVSTDQPLFSSIYDGIYREWQGLFARPPRVQGFSLPVYKLLPVDGGCILFSDHDRWSQGMRRP
jgi:hypothetical protein